MSPTYTEFIMDTFWPQVLGETGVVGLVGYAAALFAMFRAALRRARDDGDARLLPLRVIATMIATYTILESFAAPTFGVAFPAALSCGLLALSTASWRPADPAGASHPYDDA
jgi:O-antigen ligase